jgi:hypothetical protein
MTPEEVFKVIDELVKFILRYAVTLAAISALAMALIEMFKALFSWRDRFHKKRLLACALSLDKMMGQVQDAADTTMSNPSLYPELYILLTRGARLEDVTNWRTWANEPPVRSAADAALAKTQADTYARLRQFIRRRLDAFQVTASYRWQTGNQVASILLGSLLLFGSLVYLAGLSWKNSPILILASLIGGIMAPVAKDLVIALKRVRSGG